MNAVDTTQPVTNYALILLVVIIVVATTTDLNYQQINTRVLVCVQLINVLIL